MRKCEGGTQASCFLEVPGSSSVLRDWEALARRMVGTLVWCPLAASRPGLSLCLRPPHNSDIMFFHLLQLCSFSEELFVGSLCGKWEKAELV